MLIMEIFTTGGAGRPLNPRIDVSDSSDTHALFGAVVIASKM